MPHRVSSMPARRVTSVNVPFAVVAPQHVRAECRDVDVRRLVVVVVADAHAGSPAAPGEAARGGHVGEAAAAVVAIQRDHRVAACGDVLARRAVDDQRVEIAVVVVVEERRAVAVGVDDEVLGRPAGDVDQIEPGLCGDVHEPDEGALCARGHRPQRRRGARPTPSRNARDIAAHSGRSVLVLGPWSLARW